MNGNFQQQLPQTKTVCNNFVPNGRALFGGVPPTPDPNTSATASRYKWEAYRDTNWWCIEYSLPRGGHTFAKVSR